MSTFTAYGIAVSGMFANRTGLSVVSNNITNVNTVGYSRQQTALAETCLLKPGGSEGTGVDVQEIRRARNSLLDQTYRKQNAQSEYWDAKSAVLTDLQSLLNEFGAEDGTDDTGLQQAMTDFFDSWDELAKDPSSQSTRSSVVEAAESLLGMLDQIDTQLKALQSDMVVKAGDAVNDINDLAQQVVELNLKILKTETADVEASDLRDQRDVLLDQMSALANIRVEEKDNGMVNVSIGGIPLVNEKNTYPLELTGDGSAANPLTVISSRLDCTVKVSGGSLKTYLEEADWSGAAAIDTAGLPYAYSAEESHSIASLWQGLNDMLVTVADAVNQLQLSGLDLDGEAGTAFFVPVDEDQPLSLGNITLNTALDDLDKIVTSTTGQAGDNTVANAIVALQEEDLFVFDGLEVDLTGFYEAVISWVGTAGTNAESTASTTASLATQADNQRLALSAVSLDEEMSRMITYQNAYSANARVLSTIDSMLADLIEQLG